MRARALRRSLSLGVVAALASATVVEAAGPQTSEVRVEARVAPGAAPTARRPRPVTLDVGLRWDLPKDEERVTLQRLVMRFPRGAVYNGGRTPACAAERISRGGLDACPKGSIVGRGSAEADADLTPTRPRITVVNGGPRRVWFYVTMTNPASIAVAVPGRIRRIGGRWSYELTVDIPVTLQIVAGIPVYLREMTVTAGRGDWIAVTRQPTAISTTTTLGPPRS
jgi:hypothetical protein